MSTQNPLFSFFSTYPGGTPLNNPDTTQSKDIEIGADGPPGNPLEITDTHKGTLKVLTPPGSVYNQSGRYLHRELNMLDGVHTYGLRANSSSLPSDTWELTVGTPVVLSENFDLIGQFLKRDEEGTLQTVHMTITATKLSSSECVWGVQPAGTEYSFPGQLDGHVFMANMAKIEINFGRACSSVRFWYTHIDYNNHRVDIHDDKGSLLGTQFLQVNRGVRADQIIFNEPNIHRLTITPGSSEALAFDRVEITAHAT
jgi:hypothetical protein